MGPAMLPAEVWLQILKNVLKSDLKSIRLCCSQQLQTLASMLLFTKAYIAARRGVLQVFQALMNHPDFRNYVTTIVYDSSYLDPKLVAAYADEVDGLERMFQDQESIRTNELYTYLGGGLTCFPNITTICYADMSRNVCLPGDRDDVPGASEGQDYLDGPLVYRSNNGRNRYCGDGRHTMFRDHGNHDYFRRQITGFCTLMQMLAGWTMGSVQDLRLGDWTFAVDRGGISLWLFSSVNAIGHSYIYQGFRHLRRLELTLSRSWLFETGTYGREDLDSVDLSKFLGSAIHLEMLKLAGPLPMIHLTKMLGDCIWSNLDTVRLEYFKASSKTLEDFMQRHAGSLCYLTLNRITLPKGSWDSVVAHASKVAPNLQIILGEISIGNSLDGCEKFSIPSNLFEEVGLTLGTNEPEILRGPGFVPEEHEDGDEDYESESSYSEYDSDDSSPSTVSNPNHESDTNLLSTMTPEFRSKVEQLQKEFPGLPVQKYRAALDHQRRFAGVGQQDDYQLTCTILLNGFADTRLSRKYPNIVEDTIKLKKDLPVAVTMMECLDAIRRSGGDYDIAKTRLMDVYGGRRLLRSQV